MRTLVALVWIASAAAAEVPAWQPEVNVRLRVESREQNFTFDRAANSPTDDTWLLSRVRLGLKGRLGSGVSLRVQLQDAREVGSTRPSTPYVLGSEGDDPLDVRELYMERKLGESLVRLGRQTLAFGDERLVGPLEWNNFGRTFDAARVTLPEAHGAIDAFVASVVRVQPAAKGGWHANHSSGRDLFAGVYIRHAVGDALKLEPYVFWRGKQDDTVYAVTGVGSARPYDIPQRVATLGLRAVGGPPEKRHGFEWDGDLAWQTGEVRGRQQVGAAFVFPGPAWEKHDAWAAHLGGGYTTKAWAFPVRLYAELNHATGDRNPGDARDESFLNLFPTNHKFYGGMDVFAWKNMSEAALTVAATLDPRTKLRVEHHAFALATTQDGWFRANAVTTVRPVTAAARGASRSAGQETDLVVTRALSARVSAEMGCSCFFAGRYLAQTGGASDARFAYVQTNVQW